MESRPIDELNFSQPNLRKKDPAVKIVAIVLCVIFLLFSFLCFRDIFDVIRDYFTFRHKFVIYFDLHRMITAVAISSIPLTAYSAWRRRFNKERFTSYLVLLTILLFLFIVLGIIGIEVIFSFSVTRFVGNSFSPSYTLYPPIPTLCFNLLFILDALILYLVFLIVSRRKNSI